MRSGSPPPVVRHRLLEAFLARLARHPDAEAFVLRGGMRVRQLLPAAGRPALDVDLICRLPYDPAAVRRRLQEILADDRIRDQVCFEIDRLQLDLLWQPRMAGMRLVAGGSAAGVDGRISVDLLFGSPPWGEPVRVPQRAGALWGCRPEAIVARKLQVVTHLGRSGWRPKDLADIDLLLGLDALDQGALGPAIEAAFEGGVESVGDAREVFDHPAWWRGRAAEARWQAFVAEAGRPVPDDLGAVVASVRHRLLPLLGRSR